MMISQKRYVLAVSGGVDSVVLLDVFSKKYQAEQLIVAHFDHGIREDSAADARFVAALAAGYGLRFESERQDLGAGAGESTARSARYGFLKRLTKKYKAILVTAHHADDVAETIAINIARGTGWRGLAVMGDRLIYRPMLNIKKQQLLEYAAKKRLEWVEDETNNSDKYFRNVIRRQLNASDVNTAELSQMRHGQKELSQEIDEEVGKLLAAHFQRRRYFLTLIDELVADELLRRLLLEAGGTPLTRPQRQRMLIHIRVGRPGSQVEVGEGLIMRLSAGEFDISTT